MNEEVLAHYGLLRQKQTKETLLEDVIRVMLQIKYYYSQFYIEKKRQEIVQYE
jgi:hypothetical protein